MLAERQRREEERERKAAEDAEYARLASARAERERAREEAVRREAEEEWRRKTAEAEQREERVRWRRRRMELRGKRIVFWRKENRGVEMLLMIPVPNLSPSQLVTREPLK